MIEGRDPNELRKMLEETPENERLFDILLDAKLRQLFGEKDEVGIISLLISTTQRLVETVSEPEVAGFILSGVMYEFAQRGRSDVAGNMATEFAQAVDFWTAKRPHTDFPKWFIKISEWCSEQETYREAFNTLLDAEEEGKIVNLHRKCPHRYWTRDDRFPWRRVTS